MVINERIDAELNRYEIPMRHGETLKEYEVRKRNEQVKMIEEELKCNHFRRIPESEESKQRFYLKDDIDTVMCVVEKTQKEKALRLYYILIDRKFYDDFIVPRRCKLGVDEVDSTMCAEDVARVIIYGDAYQTERDEEKEKSGNDINGLEYGLSRYVYLDNYYNINSDSKINGKDIDHKTHNHFINIKEYLRPCEPRENNNNKSNRRLVIVNEDKLYFRVKESEISGATKKILLEDEYKKKWQSLYSPTYNTREELNREVQRIEEKEFGKFRYNPWEDFSETWYILVYERMFKKISKEDVTKFQKDYMLRYHAEIARYYL